MLHNLILSKTLRMNRKKYGELLEHAIEKAVELTCIQNSQYLNYTILVTKILLSVTELEGVTV